MATPLSPADIALRATVEKAYFQRLARLLLCGGTTLLREVFDFKLPSSNLQIKLSDATIQGRLQKLRHKKILTEPEWNLLYPSAGVYGESTDFDITLLFKLFRNLGILACPATGWDNLPNCTDHSLEADIVRIKFYRNQVHGHTINMEISDSEFVNLWSEISGSLLRIADSISNAKKDEWKKSIDKFQYDPLTPDANLNLEELRSWYKKDMETKDEVEKLRYELKENMNIMEEKMNIKLEEIRRDLLQQLQNPRHEPTNNLRQHTCMIDIEITPESIQSSNIPPGHFINSPQLEEANQRSERECVISIQAEGATEQPTGELQANQQRPPTNLDFWYVLYSFKEPIILLVKYLRVKLGVDVVDNRIGSLIITVSCNSLQILEGLWKDYQSGHLSKVVQETLVTAEVLKELGLSEVNLKTTISVKEYEACRSELLTAERLDQRLGGAPALQRHEPMIEKLLRDFAAVNFEEDGNYFPVSHSRAQEIRPLVLMAKKERSFWERPLKQYKYVALSRMEKYAARGKEQELLDALNLHVKKEDCDLTPEEDNESEDEEEEELPTSSEHTTIRIKGHDELGFLDLGRVDQEYIPGPNLREILANTELDRSKIIAFKGQQLRLITSVINSERFEHKGLRFTEVEAIPNPYALLKGKSKKRLIPPKIATRNTRGPFLFKCCRVAYNEETNRLELVKMEGGRKDGGHRDEAHGMSEEEEEYENTVLGLDERESELADSFTEEDSKKLEKIKESVLVPTKNREERKARVNKYLQWFEEALTRKQKVLFPFGGLTKADRAFLQSIYISAPPYQSTVDLSSFTDEKIQGYAIVLKIIAELTDTQWDEIEKAWAESGQ